MVVGDSSTPKTQTGAVSAARGNSGTTTRRSRKIVHKAPTVTAQEAIAEHISDIEYGHSTTIFGNERFQERELSWLQFNERVLELAEDDSIPLLERVQFSAIFASNLDEFFMVRVAGLKRRINAGLAVSGASGLVPTQVLRQTLERSAQLQKRHAQNWSKNLHPKLKSAGINIMKLTDLSTQEKHQLTDIFKMQIFPVLTPLAVDPAHPFPYISGGSLSLGVILENPKTSASHFARVKIPSNIPRFIQVKFDESDAFGFVALEDLICEHLNLLFPGMLINEVCAFRVTRNEDIDVEEDDAENLLKAMERELLRRRFGPPIRLEVENTISENLRSWLVRELGIQDDETISLDAPLDHTGLFELMKLDRPELKYKKFLPRTHRFLSNKQSSSPVDIFDCMRKGDILLHHPYDSFSTSVQRFLEQAAQDPQVLAIKQTLYRTSGDSPIIDALVDAAKAGKQVLALVEIKARFDEQANIEWARKLEKAGVHVVYGIVGLKTHCKLSLVVRADNNGEIHYYSHIGTGNYNPKTARMYTDHGLLTSDEVVGQDVVRLFNQLSGYAPKSSYKRLLVAPKSMRKGIIARIENERRVALAGGEAWIKIKVNSVVDEVCIDALYRAAEAGVKVDMIVRGICAIKPGVTGIHKNIRVRSILGRFLEHSRIYAFRNPLPEVADDLKNEVFLRQEDVVPEVWIGSADLMHRNLDRRVEVLVKIVHYSQIQELVNLLDYSMSDKITAWDLDKDGQYIRKTVDADGNLLVSIQEEIIAKSRKAKGSTKLK
jgi:polyphosphate kinase